jgi:hypothetical protein
MTIIEEFAEKVRENTDTFSLTNEKDGMQYTFLQMQYGTARFIYMMQHGKEMQVEESARLIALVTRKNEVVLTDAYALRRGYEPLPEGVSLFDKKRESFISYEDNIRIPEYVAKLDATEHVLSENEIRDAELNARRYILGCDSLGRYPNFRICEGNMYKILAEVETREYYEEKYNTRYSNALIETKAYNDYIMRLVEEDKIVPEWEKTLAFALINSDAVNVNVEFEKK